MRRKIGVLLLLVFLVTRGAVPALAAPDVEPVHVRALTSAHFDRTPTRLSRGKYLAESLLQCFLCHSERDWSKPGAPPISATKGSGHVFHNEPGYVLAAPNITPDIQTGAGSWTDDMLARAIREGVGHDGRALHPQMWYDAFAFLTDEDVASVVVYLRSLPAIHRAQPTRVLPSDVAQNIRNNPKPVLKEIPPPEPSTLSGRGEYLVAIANCIGCHTAWEAPSNPGLFAGGNLVRFGDHSAFSANLTPDPSGISYYNPDFFVEVLRNGAAKARKLSPTMPWIVFRNLTDEDLKAIYSCVQNLAPVHHVVTNDEPPTQCILCGQKHGGGDRNRKKEITLAKIDTSVYASYTGEYTYPWGQSFTITSDHGRLYMQSEFGKNELLPVSQTVFDAPDMPGPIEFVRDKAGKVLYVWDRTPYGRATRTREAHP